MSAITDAKLLWNKRVILAALEATYGTDAVPTGAQAVRIYEAQAPAMAGTPVELKPVVPYLGATKKRMSQVHRTTNFMTPLTGSGAAGTAPAFDPCLQMSAFASTIITPAATIGAAPAAAIPAPVGTWTYVKGAPYAGTADLAVTITCTTGGASGAAKATVSAPASGLMAGYSATNVTITTGQALALPGGATITPTIGTAWAVGDTWTVNLLAPSVRYNPVSAGFASASLYYHLDGIRYRMMGTRGKASFDFTAGQIAKLTIDAVGLWASAEAAAIPVPDFSKYLEPDVVSFLNTPAFTLFGQPLVLQSLTFANGTAPTYRDRVNQARVEIGDRPYSGKVTADLPQVATWDPEAAALSGAMGSLSLTHGMSAGHIVQVDAANVQLSNVVLQEDSNTGITTFSADIAFLPSSVGNDDVIISFR